MRRIPEGTDPHAARASTLARILFLVWMLAVLIGTALSAPQVPGMPIVSHQTAGENG
jgi:hypothetical protein